MKLNENLDPKPDTAGVYNPLTSDFSVTYDIKGNSQPETFTAKSLEITYFPNVVAEHIKKHLQNAVINERSLNPIIPSVRDEVWEEISV